MSITQIILIVIIIFFLYLIFFKNRVVISENMANTEFHKNDDYNV